jgi:hypothetical protein
MKKKQTHFDVSSDDESDAPPPTNPVDSENLMATQMGNNAVFVFDETGSDEEDDIPPRTSSVRKRKRPGPVVESDSESSSQSDDDDDGDSDSAKEVATPPAKMRKANRQADEEEDLAADLENLRSSPPSFSPRGTQSKQAMRAKRLEELKRLRDKRKPKSASAQKRKRTVVLDSDDDESLEVMSNRDGTDSDADSAIVDGDDVEEEEEVDAYQVFEEQEGDDDFIVDDDEVEDHLGVPTSSIPIAFTGWATSKPRELFKFAIDWFVQKNINPAFDRDDDIYRLTWQKLNDEITGLAGSKFTSSAWNRDFTYALNSRPLMRTDRVPWDGEDCQACNRTGHAATYKVEFSGPPYNPYTYEEVEQESDEEAEGITRDWNKNKIPPEDRTYAMGSTCFKNAQVAHRLKHWRYSLGEFVLSYLDDIGELEGSKIVERDGWKEVKRRNHANDIVQRMEDEGEIQSLYKTMKHEVNDARGIIDLD